VGLVSGLVLGLVLGLVAGSLTYGGEAVIKHYVLRLFLRVGEPHLPLRGLVRFLDYATDLILLRRVGGGYIFMHRRLLEYFAELEVETPPAAK
jgi:hypothetical protein